MKKTNRIEYSDGQISFELIQDDFHYRVRLDRCRDMEEIEKRLEYAVMAAAYKLNGEIQELKEQNREMHERLMNGDYFYHARR